MITLLSLLFFYQFTAAQGCIALRGLGFSSCSMNMAELQQKDAHQPKHFWQVETDFTYFRSFRHFIGTAEQPQRSQMHNNVINHAYNTNITLTYGINDRWSLEELFPIVYFTRSQVIRGTSQREMTSAGGIGDIRLSAGYWLFDPEKQAKGNLQAALGIKLPTGKDDAQDTFYSSGTGGKLTGAPQTVDQSIMPGDGGLGFTVELNGYQVLSKQLQGYASFFYLFNPRGTNGVPTFRRNPFEAVMSVPDQYMARAGVTYMFTRLHDLSASIGARMEGIPVYDLIGSSEGFRRPGYVISAEPGVSYMYGRSNFNLTVPVAIVRNRTQSVPDKERQAATGTPQHGDAAFADYLINVGYTYRF